MLKKLWHIALLVVLVLAVTPAGAWVHGKVSAGACSLSLNFAQACNSQYLR